MIHVLHTFANNSSVPYLSWFADRAKQEGNIRYSFLIMHRERPEMLDEMRHRGYTCEWFPFDPEKRKRGMLMALPWLFDHIRSLEPDIVHCNLFDDSLPGITAARLAGIKVRVVTRQDTGFHWMHARKWMQADRYISSLATHVIAISRESEKFLIEKEGTPPRKITMIHNGIPPERFTDQDPTIMKEMRVRFGLNGRHPVIGTVARFIKWKGHRYIIEAAKIITQEYPSAKFLFCGAEGDQKDLIQQQINDAGLQDHVVFTGWISREHMASFYGILDLYLHAAVLEPFGLVYAEAMMNGIPIVSTPTGAALDAIRSGENGVLVQERSGPAIAQAVLGTLSDQPGLMGENGRRTALEMYTFENMWQRTTNLYRRALRSR